MRYITPMDSSNQKPSRPPQFSLKADDSTAVGRFANLAQVGSTPEVFILDFAFMQGPAGWLLSRIFLSPAHAKRFHAVLSDTIARFEERHGPIDPGPTLQ